MQSRNRTHRTVKEIRPRHTVLKSKCGKNLTEKNEIKQRWKEYTETLYKRDDQIQEIFEEGEHEIEPMVLESEVRKALYDINNKKAPGDDNIPVELRKEGGDEVI